MLKETRAYLEYSEDVSKNHPGGLKHRKTMPKIVQHYGNPDNPGRCFVRLFKLYNSLCPTNRPDNAFYLSPLSNPKPTCWYSRAPLGHNKLRNAVADMCKQAGIPGYHTNHSLQATAATCLYHPGVDEQLVMERAQGIAVWKVFRLTKTLLNNNVQLFQIFLTSRSNAWSLLTRLNNKLHTQLTHCL